MLKWALALALAVFLLGLFRSWLARRLRLGRLPGDMALRYRGRDYRFPFASTLLLSLLLALISRLL